MDQEIYYWSNDRGNAEVGFIIESDSQVLPIEAKAETNLKAKKAWRYIGSCFHPNLVIMSNFIT